MNGLEPASPTPSPSAARRLGRRAMGVVLGLAIPTGFLAWVFGFDVLKRWINGRVWCADADEVIIDVTLTSSGSSTRISDLLVCRIDGAVVRTIGDVRMMATNIVAAFVVCLVLIGLLVLCLKTYSKLRRRPV